MAASDPPAEESKSQDQQPQAATQHLFTADALPTSPSLVATEVMKIPAELQRSQAVALLTFLRDTNSTLLQLNADTTPYTFLVHVPGTSNVQLCYGLGVGASGIGYTSPLDGYFLTLTGDGGKHKGTPSILQFPITRRTVQKNGKNDT